MTLASCLSVSGRLGFISKSCEKREDSQEIFRRKSQIDLKKKCSPFLDCFSDPAGIRTQDPPDESRDALPAELPRLKIYLSLFIKASMKTLDFFFLISVSLLFAEIKF